MTAVSVLRYPYEAITETTDYFQISIKKYEAADLVAAPVYGTINNVRNVSSTASSGNPNPEQLVEDGIILLPMPSNIQDSNNVGFGPDTLDAVSALGAGAVETIIDQSSDAISNFFTEGNAAAGDVTTLLNKFGDTANTVVAQIGKQADVSEQIVKALAAQAASLIPGVNVSAQQLLTRGTGKILNPNMELLFNGVQLRSFSYQFKMTPRDQTESNQVKSIIRSLKRNMAPKVTNTTTFLTTPNIFELSYRKGGHSHPFLHKFKQCALTNMGVNYTGENVYATYGDGTPISMIMQLSFQELVPIYDRDYNDKDSSGAYTDSFNNSQLQYQPNADTEGVGY